MTIERFLTIVNKVTAYHRHGNPIPKEALDKLCNAQIELEKQLQNASSNSDYEKCKELLQIINNSETIKASPAVTLFVIKEKLEKHFA